MARKTRKGSANELELEFQLQHATKFYFRREYRWHPSREFRADFAVFGVSKDEEQKPLLVEIDGAKRGAPGAHQRVDGIDEDCRRMSEALCLGYVVLRVSSRMVRDGTALQYIEKLIARMAQ